MLRYLLPICLIITLMFFLEGCTHSNKSPSSEVLSSNLSNTSSHTDVDILNMESNNVVDLPNKLYYSDQSAYANTLNHDFKVEAKTQFTIAVVAINGKFSLAIKDKNTKEFVYDMKEFQSETDTVTLKKGSYSIIIYKNEFTGKYSVNGVPVK